jgi:hypothetical protein
VRARTRELQVREVVGAARRRRERRAAPHDPARLILSLQRSAGNAATSRLLMRAPTPRVTPRRTKRLVYVDGSVLDQVNRGNTAMAQKLRELSGTATLRMTGYNYAEMTGKGDPALRKANQLLIEDLGIGVDKQLTMAQRTKRGMEAWGDKPRVPKAALIQPKDVPMVAGVPKGAELWTVDKTIRSNPARVEEAFNIRIAPETTSIPPNATARPSYAEGRRLLNLDTVVIDAQGKLVERGTQGSVIRGAVKTDVPSGTIVSGEIGGRPAPGPSGAGGGGGGGGASPSGAKAATEGTEAAAESAASPKLSKRLAAKLGAELVEGLVPGPLDALELMYDFAGSYKEAWDRIKADNLTTGFAIGLAAYLIVPRWEWALYHARTVVSRDVVTQVLGAVGIAENAYNEGLVRGFVYGEKHSPAEAQKLRQKVFDALVKAGRMPGRYEGDDVYTFGRDDVYAFAVALMPTAVAVLKEAERRKKARLESERLREEAKRWSRPPTVGYKL